MTQLALSTMWMQKRYQFLEEFFEAGRKLGFDTFELSHQVTEELLQTASLPVGDIQGIHAPCPSNPRTRSAQVSSLDKEERALAVEAITDTGEVIKFGKDEEKSRQPKMPMGLLGLAGNR